MKALWRSLVYRRPRIDEQAQALWQQASELRASGLFDYDWYLHEYPDIAEAGVDPVFHYLLHGASEGRDPSASFSTRSYKDRNPEVAQNGLNPLLHFLRSGTADGRLIDAKACSGLSDTVADMRSAATRADRWKLPKSQFARVVFVSGMPDNTSHIFRVEHHATALNEAGISARWISVTDVDAYARNLLASEIIVWFRLALSENIRTIIDKCRRAGILIIFDVDDHAFDPEIANEKYVDGIRFLAAHDVPLYHQGVLGYNALARAADAGIFPTEVLAESMTRLGKDAYVIRNGFGEDTLETSELAFAQRQRAADNGHIRIGYASGSLTHQRDFEAASQAIARILAENDRVLLTVVGKLIPDEFLDLSRYKHRIEKRDLVPHDLLPYELARFDIKIAPLEIGNPYCEAKSELKYYEAALVRVPIVASATQPFRVAIKHGVNGMLARNPHDWYVGLAKLIQDKKLRSQMGARAYSHAVQFYGPKAKREAITPLFARLLNARQKRFGAL